MKEVLRRALAQTVSGAAANPVALVVVAAAWVCYLTGVLMLAWR